MSAAFAPGTRVRRLDDGRTGTVDPTAVDTSTIDSRLDVSGMVPVQYDHDDAWLTHPDVLEVVLPADVAAAVDEGLAVAHAENSETTLDLGAPAWAQHVDDTVGEGWEHDPTAMVTQYSAARYVEGHMQVEMRQDVHRDGTTRGPYVYVYADCEDLDPDAARRLALAILDAARTVQQQLST